ncbi:MAG: hypothetical protein C0422_09790 [Alcaligenaceae bacterium]|nr:hypothetical protein [Alcaligenaceae bacterium]
MSAFAMGMANRGNELKVFDWIKAAHLINEHKASEADAGLGEDWSWTAGAILKNGLPVHDPYTFLASTWATPQIEIDGQRYDCFVMQSERPEWNSDTKWPEEALAQFALSSTTTTQPRLAQE